MARYYRRRYTRVVKPKKKWATNLVDLQPLSVVENNTLVFYSNICQNSNPVSVPTPVILKTGNFKLQADVSFQLSAAGGVNFSCYMVFVPEGMLPNPVTFNSLYTLIIKHPEWILCWKYGSNDFAEIGAKTNTECVRVSSRLKRNLNSGDCIYFVAFATTEPGGTFTWHDLKGMCQFWTCAN